MEDQKKYVPRMKRLQQEKENATTSRGSTDADRLADDLKELSLKPSMPVKASENRATEAGPLTTAKKERQKKTDDAIARHNQSHVTSQTDSAPDKKLPREEMEKAGKSETSSTNGRQVIETGSQAPAAKYIPPWKREKSRDSNA